jgi:hypothetical protein
LGIPEVAKNTCCTPAFFLLRWPLFDMDARSVTVWESIGRSVWWAQFGTGRYLARVGSPCATQFARNASPPRTLRSPSRSIDANVPSTTLQLKLQLVTKTGGPTVPVRCRAQRWNTCTQQAEPAQSLDRGIPRFFHTKRFTTKARSTRRTTEQSSYSGSGIFNQYFTTSM